MEIYICESFKEVSAETFWHLLGNLNWSRIAYCGGEYYDATDYKTRVGIHASDGDRYFVDPTFFKKADMA